VTIFFALFYLQPHSNNSPVLFIWLCVFVFLCWGPTSALGANLSLSRGRILTGQSKIYRREGKEEREKGRAGRRGGGGGGKRKKIKKKKTKPVSRRPLPRPPPFCIPPNTDRFSLFGRRLATVPAGWVHPLPGVPPPTRGWGAGCGRGRMVRSYLPMGRLGGGRGGVGAGYFYPFSAPITISYKTRSPKSEIPSFSTFGLRLGKYSGFCHSILGLVA
jgi:hypothetical protein